MTNEVDISERWLLMYAPRPLKPSLLITQPGRISIGQPKVMQSAVMDTWANVLLQDFTSASDIDWNKDVEDIDRQLYKKYGLDEEEIVFIESMMKPMA